MRGSGRNHRRQIVQGRLQSLSIVDDSPHHAAARFRSSDQQGVDFSEGFSATGY
jgi:hypothetical protein